MNIDISSLISGFLGSAIGVFAAFLIALLQKRWTAQENEKQRIHERALQESQHRHDKDMERRAENIKRTGIASMREVGGG